MLLEGIRLGRLCVRRLVPEGHVGPRGRDFSCEEFDDSAILFLLECGAEHLPVFRQVIGFVLGPTGLISASGF